jgi:uncharacterized OB-fold protein
MSDAGYRDDREALRARVEELEAKLASVGGCAEDLSVGPSSECPACGIEAVGRFVEAKRDGVDVETVVGRDPSSPLPWPTACSAGARVEIGWFHRCSRKDRHFHETCNACGHKWLSAFSG